MSNSKKIAERIEEKEESEFTNRKLELELFDTLLNSKQLDKPILNLYGIGGIGKTTIIKRYLRICNKLKIPSALVDLRAQRSDFIEFLDEFHSQLENQIISFGIESNLFSEYVKISKKMHEIEQHLEKSSAKNDFLKEAASGGLESTASGLAGGIIGSIVGPIGTVIGAGLGTIAGKGLMFKHGEKAVASLLNKGLSLKDSQYLANIVFHLTKSFADAVNSLCYITNRVVLIFDTYEEIAPALDSWIRENLIPSLVTNVLIVICGKDQLSTHNVNWTQYSQFINSCEIKKFKEDDAKSFLIKKEITNSDIINEIVKYTECLPWALALMIDMKNEGIEFTTEFLNSNKYKQIIGFKVVRRFLNQIRDSDLAEILDVCTVARRFDLNLLEKILKKNNLKQSYNRLRFYSFIRTLNDGSLALHDIVRSFMLTEIKNNSYQTYINLNQQLQEYYKIRFEEREPEQFKKRDVVECLYHALNANEDKGIILFRSVISKLDIYYQFDFRDSLLNEVVNYEFSRNENILWQRYCKAYQAVNKGNWVLSKNELQALLLTKDLDKILRCLVLDTLGEIYTGQGLYSKAIVLYEESVKLKSTLKFSEGLIAVGQTLSKLSEEYAIVGKYSLAEQRALENMEKCIRANSFQGKAWALKSLGDIYRLWGKTGLSTEKFEESLAIFRNYNEEFGISTVLTQLGRVYAHSGNWTNASKCLIDAKEIFEKLGVEYGKANTILFLGNIARFKQHWEIAEKMYLDALVIHERMDSKREIGPLFGSLGIVYAHQGRYDEAKKNLEKSLEMKRGQEYDRGISVTLIYYGDFYLLQNKYHEGLEKYKEALLYAEKSNSNYHCVETRTKIVNILWLMKMCAEIKLYIHQAYRLARLYNYPHQLAKLTLTLAHIELEKNELKKASSLYLISFRYAKRYNYYLLDQTLDLVLSQLASIIQTDNFEFIRKIVLDFIQWWQKQKLEILEYNTWFNEQNSTKMNFMDKCNNFLTIHF